MSRIKLVITTTLEFDVSEKGLKEFEEELIAQRVEFNKDPSKFDIGAFNSVLNVYDTEGILGAFLHNSVKVSEEDYVETLSERSLIPAEASELISNPTGNVIVSGEIL